MRAVTLAKQRRVAGQSLKIRKTVMTNQPPQPPHQPPVVAGPAYQPPPQGDWTPPKPTRGPLPWLIGALVVLVLVVGGLIAALAGSSGKPTAGTTTPPLPQDACGGGICNTEPAAAAEAPTTTAAASRPYPSNFELTPKITSKQCFGSAGCNVEIEVKVGYDGTTLSEDDTWQVTYELTGDESGPIIGSFEVTGETYEVNNEILSTKSSKTKISIKVTDVEKVGL